MSDRPPPPSYLDALEESMHGHRKKTLFFLERLGEYARERDRRPDQLTVLELGCGNGRIVSLPVAERGYRLHGVDVHAPSVESARRYNRLANASFSVGTAEEFSGAGRYDVVILSDVLEHVMDPGALLRTAVSALAADGMVLVSVPNGTGPYELEQRFTRTRPGRTLVRLSRTLLVAGARTRRKLKGLPWPPEQVPCDQPAYNEQSGHVQFFRLRDLRRLLSGAGLTIVSQRNGAFVGGDLTYALFVAVPGLVRLSLRLADAVPRRLAATWYFDCRPAPEERRMTGATPGAWTPRPRSEASRLAGRR